MSGKPYPLRIGWLLSLCTAAIAVVVAAARPDLVGLAEESSMDSSHNPIQISADWCQEWREGETTIALFRGSCRIMQGEQVYSANNMVVWVRGTQPGDVAEGESQQRLTVYMEDSVEVQDANGSRTEQSLWVDLISDAGLTLAVRGRVAERPGTEDPLFRRALHRKNGSERGSLQQTQLTVPSLDDRHGRIVSVQQSGSPQPAGGLRRVRISPRSFAMPFNVQSFKSENTVPPEQVTILSGGVNVLIDGLIVGGDEGFGAIDLSADRVVVWTEATDRGFESEMLQRPDASFQLYLEGNIVIRQQSRFAQFGGREVSNVVRASRAYYDGRDNRALILDAELQTYVPELDAGVRVRAERLRQNSLKSKTTMLSGDKMNVVKFVADKLGIDNAFGDLLPEDKVNKVKEIKDRKETVAFVGDGVNDAPVVALSDVGIAMGGLGSDATIETADVVIQDDKPSRIAMAINIGKQTKKIVWQNIILAFAVKAVVLVLGAGGLATMWEAVFADVGVALLAILNAVRIQRMTF